MIDCSWPRSIPCAGSPHLHVAGTQSHILTSIYSLGALLRRGLDVHARAERWGKPRRVRRAVRVRRRRVCYGGRAGGGRAGCVPKARSLASGTAARKRTAAVGPGPHLQGVHVLQTRDLLTVIHLLPRKAGRCDAAPQPARLRSAEGSCHRHGIVLLARRARRPRMGKAHRGRCGPWLTVGASMWSG